MRILIKGGRVIDPGRVNGPADVLIDNGKIVAVGQKLDPPAGKADPSTTIIDARGKLVLPGVVDQQEPLREPGVEYMQKMQAGTTDASSGGWNMRANPATRSSPEPRRRSPGVLPPSAACQTRVQSMTTSRSLSSSSSRPAWPATPMCFRWGPSPKAPRAKNWPRSASC